MDKQHTALNQEQALAFTPSVTWHLPAGVGGLVFVDKQTRRALFLACLGANNDA